MAGGGEEGIDYRLDKDNESIEDQESVDEKRMLKEIKAWIQAYKLKDYEKAVEIEDYVFERTGKDDFLDQELDPTEIKFYPGSPRGPHPNDDPEFYKKWFIEN